MKRLVLVRHGESIWNLENRFTGWTDVGLSERGMQEALAAGRILAHDGFAFDVAYTSVLKRAVKTLWVVLEEMDLMWIPVHRTWRLNERHYGALQGLNKAETAAKYGEAQTKLWRRSYSVRPPALDRSDERFPGRDRRYAGLTPEQLPLTECLRGHGCPLPSLLGRCDCAVHPPRRACAYRGARQQPPSPGKAPGPSVR